MSSFALAETSLRLDQPSVEVGYKRIYSDGPSSWIIAKPETPASETLGITLTTEGPQNYHIVLKDMLLTQSFAELEGTSQDGANALVMTIPGGLKSGLYKVVATVGESTLPAQTLTVYGNLMSEGTRVSTNGRGGDGSVEVVHDFTISTFAPTVGEATTQETAVDLNFTFDLPHASEVSSIDLYSSHRNQQTPSEVEIYYEDAEGSMQLAERFSNLSWNSYLSTEQGDAETYKNVRLKSSVHLSTPVRTLKLMVKITKGYHQWTKISINEVMLWGYEISDQFSMTPDSQSAEVGSISPVHMSGIGVEAFANKRVMFELLKGDTLLYSKEAAYISGTLDATLDLPRDLTAGAYTLRAIDPENNATLRSFSYNVRAQKTYETDIKSDLKAFTSSYTTWQELSHVLDNDYESADSTAAVKLWNKWVDVHHPYSLRMVKIYTPENSFKTLSIKLGLADNSNAAYTSYEQVAPSWQTDEHGSYVAYFMPEKMLAYGFEFSFDTQVDVREIDAEGIYFDTNILEYSKVSVNGAPLNTNNFLDNAVLTASDIAVQAGAKNELVLSTDDGGSYELDHLFLAVKNSAANAPKNVELFAWQDGAWKQIELSVTNDGERTDNLLQMIEYSFPTTTTTKLKLTGDFASSSVSWVELNALGTKVDSAEAAALQISEADPIFPGKASLTLENLRTKVNNWKDLYDLSLDYSSNESVIDLSGHIMPPAEESHVTVRFRLTPKAGGTAGISKDIEVVIPKALDAKLAAADLTTDYATTYNNPAMGWVIYVEGFESAVYNRFRDGSPTQILNWNARNKGLSVQVNGDAQSAKNFTTQMDELLEAGLPVQILYIRQPWSWFEPTEGAYAWDDPNSALYVLESWAKEHNIQLAFRVLTNSSACAEQAVPDFVFEGPNASAFLVKNYDYVKNVREPYVDDPNFVEKFDAFIAAFAKQYDNEHTAYIDGHGHGQWGEMNGEVFLKGNANDAIMRLQTIYATHFSNVLLGGQVESGVGRDSIRKSFDTEGANFAMRRDAYGSDKYLNGHMAFIKRLRLQGIPMFAENCYHHFDSRNFRWSRNMAYSSGSVGEYGGDNPFYTLHGLFDHLLYHATITQANSLDLRTIEDAKILKAYGQRHLDKWVQEGGYRISLLEATYPKEIARVQSGASTLSVSSLWQNLGVGVVPNNNKRWNKKMKVAYAIVDEAGHVVKNYVVSPDDINVGTFEKYEIKGGDWDKSHLATYAYTTKLELPSDLASGTYRLAVAIVNSKLSEEKAGLTLANVGETTDAGYLVLGSFSYTSLADKNEPVGKDLTINRGEEAQASSAIENADALEGVSSIAFVSTPDTSKDTDVPATVRVSYSDGTYDDVEISIHVRSYAEQFSPVAASFDVAYGAELKAKDGIANADSFKDVLENVSFEEAPDTHVSGARTVRVVVSYSDGTSDVVDVPLTVGEMPTPDEPKEPAEPEDPKGPDAGTEPEAPVVDPAPTTEQPAKPEADTGTHHVATRAVAAGVRAAETFVEKSVRTLQTHMVGGRSVASTTTSNSSEASANSTEFRVSGETGLVSRASASFDASHYELRISTTSQNSATESLYKKVFAEASAAKLMYFSLVKHDGATEAEDKLGDGRSINVTLVVPSELKGATALSLYYVNVQDGQLEELPVTLGQDGNEVSFTLDHLSSFVLADAIDKSALQKALDAAQSFMGTASFEALDAAAKAAYQEAYATGQAQLTSKTYNPDEVKSTIAALQVPATKTAPAAVQESAGAAVPLELIVAGIFVLAAGFAVLVAKYLKGRR